MSQGTVEIREGKIIFSPSIFPTSQVRILGFNWNGSAWVAPISLDRFTGLNRIFNNLIADPSVKEWLSALRAPIGELSSEIREDLFPFQRDAVKFLMKNNTRGALLALAPGLGKTICAIRAALALNRKKILIIAPLSLLLNWKKEIIRWSGDTSIEVIHGAFTGSPAKWIITNYDTIRIQEPAGIYDQIIIDESVCIKNRKAERTEAVYQWIRSTLGGSAWLLSGAPTTKFYDDLWSQLHAIDPGRFSSYWRFAERYCYIERNQWGSKISQNRVGAETDLKRDLADVYFSRTQDDVLDLPEILYETLDIAMEPEQSRIYAEMESDFLAHLGELDEDVVLAPNVLVQLTRLLQIASNPKLIGGKDGSGKRSALVDLLSRSEFPVIVWSNFIQSAEDLKNVLGKIKGKPYRVEVLNGSTPVEERQSIVDRFQRKEIEVLIAHPAVGKFGLTLTAARSALYLERSFMADDYYQSLYRIRRIGMESRSPSVIHLLSVTPEGEQTVDHVVDRVLGSRVDATRKLTAGMLLYQFHR